MELGAHHIVVVARQHADAVARLPVPDADGLIVGGAQNPRVFVVEGHRTHVVQMGQQGEDAAALLVVPHLDLVIISAGNEKGHLLVEGHASHRSVVLVELFEERVHPVVPQLDDATVQADQDPGAFRVEGEALHPRRLGLEVGQHVGTFSDLPVYVSQNGIFWLSAFPSSALFRLVRALACINIRNSRCVVLLSAIRINWKTRNLLPTIKFMKNTNQSLKL